MTQPDPSLPPDQAVERLLVETHLRVRQGRYEEARERLAQAKQLAPEHYAVLEMEGDLAFAQGRYRQAESLYRQAFKLNPANAKLEEKFATALVKVHEPEFHIHLGSDDESFWSFRVPRSPITTALSACFSLFLPGPGQLVNGDLLKGAGLLFFELMCWSYLWTPTTRILHQLHEQGAPVSIGAVLMGLMHGASVVALLLMLAARIYSVVDTAWVGKIVRDEHAPPSPPLPLGELPPTKPKK